MKKYTVAQAQFVGGELDGRLVDANWSFFQISTAVDTDQPGRWARSYRRIERPSADPAVPQAFFIDKSIEALDIDAQIARCTKQFAPG